MPNLEEMPAYFWLASSQLKTPIKNDVPYTDQALKQDLIRVRNAWEDAQGCRDRGAIYGYLSSVFDLVAWWVAENRAVERARKALRLANLMPSDRDEPFGAVICCTSDTAKVDKRTRSKWSRALRYALQFKSPTEPLDGFIKRKGKINKCAERYTRLKRRSRQASQCSKSGKKSES
jgi:hypothetical protein